MPPKKEVKSPKSGEEAEPDEEERELVEKELVINYLKTKLGRYQERGETLLIENVKLTDELEEQKDNLRDINEFLTNELKARSLAGAALEQRITELEKELATVKSKAEADVKRLQSEKEAEVAQKDTALQEIEKKMHSSKSFLDQKDDLEATFKALQETLQAERKAFEKRISDLERQQVQEKDRWQKELVTRVQETKDRMQRATENQLETLTKRTILENELMDAELKYQSRQVEKLVHRNKELMEESAAMKRTVSLARQTEDELAKRNHIYQKTIKTLLTKLMTHTATTNESREVVEHLQERIDNLEEEVDITRAKLDTAASTTDQLESEVVAKTAALAELEGKLDETSRFLLKCVEDIQQKAVTVVREETSGQDDVTITVLPARLEELAQEQRQQALQFLLDKMRPLTMTGRLKLDTAKAAQTGCNSVQLSAVSSSTSIGRRQPTHSKASDADAQRATSHKAAASMSTQTRSPNLASPESLIREVLADVRPWGKRLSPKGLKPQGSCISDVAIRK
ncbi:hypothetical protein WJX72_002415 [[Myrmecia] bisecta]|uniref:Cilia- and flagella-associated protein 157 n=1 Tax=[Myrmecia] bisecta TaxID=41462 RepID=A0AAW1Q8P2_9CHLO